MHIRTILGTRWPHSAVICGVIMREGNHVIGLDTCQDRPLRVVKYLDEEGTGAAVVTTNATYNTFWVGYENLIF